MGQGCDRKKKNKKKKYCDGPIRDVTGASFVSILISYSCFLLSFTSTVSSIEEGGGEISRRQLERQFMLVSVRAHVTRK
jgi:hypothetical protein